MTGRPNPRTALGAVGAIGLLTVGVTAGPDPPLGLTGWQVAVAIAAVAALLVGLSHRLAEPMFRRGLIVALILAVSISPELPMELLLAGDEAVVIRFEDILIAAVVASWPWLVADPWDLPALPFGRPVATFLGLSLLVTLGAVGLSGLPSVRSLLYFAKQVEFVLFAVVVAALIRDRRDLAVFLGAVLAGGVLNAVWMSYQILVGEFEPLFPAIAIVELRYGPALIGQPSVLASAAFFLAPLFVAYGRVVTAIERRPRLAYGGLVALFLAMIFVTVSRATIGAALVMLVALSVLARSAISARQAGGIAGAVLLLAVPVGLTNPLFVRRFLVRAVRRGVGSRLDIWRSVVEGLGWQLAIGAGTGSTGVVVGIEEAHNHYLRVLAESGVLGLALFLLTMGTILWMGYVTFRRGTDRLVRTTGLACLGTTGAMLSIAVFQDVFISVTVAESFWLVCGATAAAASFGTDGEVYVPLR